MSMSFYPTGWEIYVDNPGYGEMVINHNEMGWQRTLVGEEIAILLTEVTKLALDMYHAPWHVLPAKTTGPAARKLLPALQRAVVLATAGTDRWERTFRDEDEPPQEPLCVRCNEGSNYSDVALPSKRCAEWGHAPFGQGAETKWERAQERYTYQRARWDAVYVNA